MTFKPYTQVAYIPDHVRGNHLERLWHSDTEFGFVINDMGANAFCRYWVKGSPGILRTVSCSELTPKRCLMEYKSVSQSIINMAIKQIKENQIP